MYITVTNMLLVTCFLGLMCGILAYWVLAHSDDPRSVPDELV